MTLPSTPPRPRSFRAEREFGLLVGAILALLGGWWIYRGKFAVLAASFVAVGSLLVACGALRPSLLALPYRLWMGLAERLSRIVTFFILSLVYYLVVTPIGVVKRATGWDPLGRRAAPAASYWRPYAARQRDPKHYEKMF